jgi:hypothetical protein
LPIEIKKKVKAQEIPNKIGWTYLVPKEVKDEKNDLNLKAQETVTKKIITSKKEEFMKSIETKYDKKE